MMPTMRADDDGEGQRAERPDDELDHEASGVRKTTRRLGRDEEAPDTHHQDGSTQADDELQRQRVGESQAPQEQRHQHQQLEDEAERQVEALHRALAHRPSPSPARTVPCGFLACLGDASLGLELEKLDQRRRARPGGAGEAGR